MQLSDKQDQRAAAVDWIRDLLETAPLPSQDVYDAARKVHVSIRDLNNAAKELGVQKRKRGFSAAPVVWMLPREPDVDKAPLPPHLRRGARGWG